MSLLIRPARPDDAPSIAAIKRAVWPGEDSAEAQIIRSLQQPDHAAHVGVAEDSRIAGFVDGFLTFAGDGSKRWEVDLLAVDPTWQGHKIGQQLIAASTEAGRQAGADVQRALVQIENIACQSAMRRCGYVCDGQIYQLMISSARRQEEAGSLGDAVLIPVITMNYSGLWLEGTLTAAALAAAQTAHTRHGGDLVGALIRADEAALLAAAPQLGYWQVERFQWWVHPR